MATSPVPNLVLAGRVTRIDYDDHGTITVIHLVEPAGYETEIRFSIPPVLADVAVDPDPVMVTFADARPEVQVVRPVR